MSRLQQLESLYNRIPSFDNCKMSGKCCIVPFAVSEFEKKRLPGQNFDAEKVEKCVFNKDGKCTVYETRPLICRLYGVSRFLGCEHNQDKLTWAEMEQLMWDYIVQFWTFDSIKGTRLIQLIHEGKEHESRRNIR